MTTVKALEMALVESGPNGMPMFRHRAFPFVQATDVEFALDDGRIASFTPYQDGTDWPLMLSFRTETAISSEYAPIFRMAYLEEFPNGLVTSAVGYPNENGRISEIGLSIGGCDVLLVAGEVIEGAGNTFAVNTMAGSVLVFAEADDRRRTVFDVALRWDE